MNQVEHSADGFAVDASRVAETFGLKDSEFQTKMREERITALGQTGEGEVAGSWRLTCFYSSRAFRLADDGNGAV